MPGLRRRSPNAAVLGAREALLFVTAREPPVRCGDRSPRKRIFTCMIRKLKSG